MNSDLGKIVILLIFLFAYSGSISQEINWTFELKDSSFGQTAAGDIDGDGFLELVFGCYRNDSCIYALNAENGTLLWKFNTSSTGFEGCNDTAPIIFDTDGDGKLDVIVPSSCTPVTYCINGADGSIKWTANSRQSDSPPTIADIDGDGKFEVLHGEFGGYVLCLNVDDGSRKWEIAVDTDSWIQTAPTIVDVDNDGNLDFVVATWNSKTGDTNRVYAYRGQDQTLLWSFDLNKFAYHGTAVADLDDDKKPELIIGDYSGKIYALNAENGSLLWDFKDSDAIYVGSPISVGDLNGDGKCDLVFCDGKKIVAVDSQGKFLWRFYNKFAATTFRGIALSDVTGEGNLDVIGASSKGNVFVLSGFTGYPLFGADFERKGVNLDFNNAPIIADFDKDDTLDIFIVGGQTTYPDFSKNFGYALSFPIGKGQGPDWLMFQGNLWRNGNLCDNEVSARNQLNESNLVAYPNPFEVKINFRSKFNIEDISEISISDNLGNVINKLNNFKLNDSQEIYWDGCDKFGLEVSSGVYYAIIKSHSHSELVKLFKK